jgi:hypothetical protein
MLLYLPIQEFQHTLAEFDPIANFYLLSHTYLVFLWHSKNLTDIGNLKSVQIITAPLVYKSLSHILVVFGQQFYFLFLAKQSLSI